MAHPRNARFPNDWRNAVAALWSGFRPAVLLAPLLAAFALGAILVRGTFEPEKQTLERAAIQILSIATALGFARFAASRRPFFLWGFGVLVVLLCREIHFVGTSTGVYVGLVALFLLALRHYESLRESLERGVTINVLAMGFFSYFLAVTVDSRWWKPRGAWPGIPGEDVFHVPLEELLELLGHVLIIGALLLAPRLPPGAAEAVRSGGPSASA